MENANEPITPEEREHREEALEKVQASLFLSGFEISPEEKAHARRFIEGEICLEQFIRDGRPHNNGTAHLGDALL